MGTIKLATTAIFALWFGMEAATAQSSGLLGDDSTNSIVFPLGASATPKVNANFKAQGVKAYVPDKTHLGTDFAAVAGDRVYAPITGDIVYYQTSNAAGVKDGWNSFIVIRDLKTNTEHVIGHFQCSLCERKGMVADKPFSATQIAVRVQAGDPIGSILPINDKTGKRVDHLHWAVNTSGVVQASGELKPGIRKDGNWGQRNGETAAQLKEADQQGWSDVQKLTYNSAVKPAVSPSAKPASAPLPAMTTSPRTNLQVLSAPVAQSTPSVAPPRGVRVNVEPTGQSTDMSSIRKDVLRLRPSGQ